MLYYIVGAISSALFIGCLYGLYDQIVTVRRRRKCYGETEVQAGYATRSLSANGFASSFFSFYAFMIYAMSLEVVEPFVFGTRMAAALATLYILFEIYRDREGRNDRLPFQCAAGAMALAVIIFLFREQLQPYSLTVSVPLTVLASFIMAQGGVAQIKRVRAERSTGAMSLTMLMVFFFKDVSNIVFGLILGLVEGWPIMLMGTVSAASKLTLIVFYFRLPRDLDRGEYST